MPICPGEIYQIFDTRCMFFSKVPTGFKGDFRLTARPTQTCADSIFSLADLARENLHALRANRFLPK
jgi:hypothetical protein